MKSLAAMDYEDQALWDFFQHYNHDLERYVKDEQVAEELLKPLSDTGSQYQLNSVLLQQRWQELDLQALPEDFDIQEICKLYVKRVQRQSIVSPDLRSLYLAQLSQDSANYLQALRGAWPDFDLDQYKARLTERYKVLDLSALTPPTRDDNDTRLMLQDVFMPQTVKESRPPSELPKERWQQLQNQDNVKNSPEAFRNDEFARLQESWVQQSSKPVLDIFTRHKLIVLGDPGSGKSSLVRYLLLSCLNPPQNDTWLEPLKGHLPLLIELRSYIAAVTGKHCDNFLDYFHYLGKSEGYALNHQELKKQLKNRSALVMFDGLDEIFDLAQREKITQEIIGFGNDYPKAKILVTSRIIGFDGAALRHAGFSEYTLQDLSLPQIHAFAQGWYQLVFKDHPQEVANRLQRIQLAVEHSPAIAQLAGNPLLLTIIAIIAKHQELPRDRVLLYEHAAKVLCHHWDVTGHKITDSHANFMLDTDKLDLLRRIAVKMQQAPSGLSGNVIQSEELQQAITDYLIQRWKQPSAKATQLSRVIIEQLHTRNFILCFYGADSYGFVHRTFLEYFCAAEVVQRFEKKQELSEDDLKTLFLKHYKDDVWHEILRLICGMIDAKFAGLLIDAILPEETGSREQNEALILAIQCLAEISDLSEIADTSKQVLACLCRWFEIEKDYRDEDIEELFEKNALPAVERIGKNWVGREDFINWIKLDNKRTFSFKGSYCFGGMVAAIWSDSVELQQDLLTLTQSQDISTLHMAFDALARCFNNPTRNLLVQQLTASNADRSTNWALACIWTLVKHYKDSPETYPLLTQCLQDEDENVRRAVIEALAQHYQDRTETFPLLTQCLQDENEDIRRAAIESLAQHYQDRTETYPLLTQCLQDGHELVRWTTVRALAQHFQDRTETYPLLKLCLQDKHEDVRQEALGALAEHNFENVKRELLSRDLDSIAPWQDPLEPITEDQVEQVAKELNLSPETIRQHYHEIVLEIPLQLEWPI
ncbi:MAG TPA: HEAT repeat domain-containing protein [Methylobacter sp.]